MLNVGLVGAGNISGAHIPAWENMPETELVAVCDIRPERLEKFEGKRVYTDFDKMLESEKLDILDICLPTYLHADYAIKAMECGINVICEKPISLNRADIKRVYSTAEKNGVKFMIAHVLRFWREFLLVKDFIDSGKYGKLLSGNMFRMGETPKASYNDWMRNEALSGFVPYDLHIHDLDFLVYALGKPKSYKFSRIKRPEQDSFSIIYDYDGVFISCQSAWYEAPVPFSNGFRFQFEKALAVYEGGKFKVYGDDSINDADDSDAFESIKGVPTTNAYENEIRYFTDCVLSDTLPDRVKPDELETVIDILNSLKA